MKRISGAILLLSLLWIVPPARAAAGGHDACKAEFNGIKEKLRKDPKDSQAWNEFRICVNELIRWSEGVAVATEALEKDPDLWQAHLVLGISELHRKDYDKAAAAFQRASELKSDSAAPRYYLGMAYLFQNRPEEAVQAAAKAVELEGSNANYHSQLAYALLLTDDRDRSETEAKKAIELDGNNVAAYKVLGNLYKKEGRQADSDMAFEEAIHANGRLASGTAASGGRSIAALPGMAPAPVRAVPDVKAIPVAPRRSSSSSSEDPEEHGPGLTIAVCREHWGAMRDAVAKGDTERALGYFSDYAGTRDQYRQAFQKLGPEKVREMFSNMGELYECKVVLGSTTCKAAVTSSRDGVVRSSEIAVRFERSPDKAWRIRSF